jgi:hypothetical protein
LFGVLRITRAAVQVPSPVFLALHPRVTISACASVRPQDLCRSVIGLPPAYIPIVGEIGTTALMPMTKESLVKYYAKQPSGGSFPPPLASRLPARVRSWR